MESQHAAPPPPPPPPPAAAEPEAPDAPEEETPKKKRHSFWRELPVLVVIAVVVALLIKTFLLLAFYIPSASMEPTLVEGDRVLVEKLSYRWGEPERGDVVVFEKEFGMPILAEEEDDPFWEDIGSALKGLFGFPTGGTQDFIKRVMAVEGDTIEGREGRVFVNGEPVDEPYLAEGTETSPFGAVEIPKDMIFVMGDNRGNSDDSRAFGPIPVDEVVGHAFLLLWPPSDFDTL